MSMYALAAATVVRTSYTLKEDLVEVVSPEPRWGVNNTLVQAAPGGPQSSLLQMVAPDLRYERV